MQASSKAAAPTAPTPPTESDATPARHESRGMWLGLVGVAVFSLTLPFTRIAVAELNPAFVAFGRAVVAGLCALALLAWIKAPRPTAQQLRGLIITALGVVVGFPLFSSIAMRYVPAAHGAVVVGLLPLATALFGALRFGERPSTGFWLAALAGSGIVIAFALRAGGGSFHPADFALFAAVLTAAMGYAEGGRLAQSMGGQNVIAWALVVALPVMLPVSLWLGWQYGVSASAPAWLAFAYVSLFSMFIGFFFWYKGLALGGIARVGQVQLLQPFMSLLGAAVIAHEALDASNMLFALAVIVVVAIGRRMAVRR
ncbi:drug/metabolite transporter (DMT)-like permease [Herbaspirillum rubrisubalbicans]|uniref:DMT family transporter n=1 Tax=Herbaspirillum rubrisubalbicans TaxID=80842 RepID=UPI003F503214|nr:drug/metabolite transporter (DMT)-like permease [Herbaspirillum rubrisubalbicans]